MRLRVVLAMTALGVAIQLERLLGIDGHPAPAPGFAYPETIPDIDSAIEHLRTFDVDVMIR